MAFEMSTLPVTPLDLDALKETERLGLGEKMILNQSRIPRKDEISVQP